MNKTVMALIGAACALLLPTAASAYVGPGSGAALLGSLWGVLVAIVLALAIVLFWPLRLVYKKIRGAKAKTKANASGDIADDTTTSAAE